MIEWLAKPATDEVGAEGFEDVFERPRPRPFADGVADVDAAGKHVGHDDIVGVGTMIHQIHDHVALGDRRERSFVLVIDADFVQEVQQDLCDVVPNLVIRQHVEVWDDLIEVRSHLAPDRLLRHSVRDHVCMHGGGDRGIVGERASREARLLFLVAA